MNLTDNEVEVYRKPQGDRYTESARVGRLEVVEIEALPGIRIEIGTIFG